MSKNIGKLFESEIKGYLESECVVAIRLPDILLQVRGKRVTTKKPFDHCGCDPRGFFIAIECKATRKDIFSFSRIEDHQAEALALVAGTEHGRAYLALNFREQKSPGQAYLIPWNWFMDFLFKWPKRSIRRNEAKKEFREFALIRKTGGWEKQGPRLI